jgi:hypothetical protein
MVLSNSDRSRAEVFTGPGSGLALGQVVPLSMGSLRVPHTGPGVW